MQIKVDNKLRKYLRSNGYAKAYLSRGLDRRINMLSENDWKRQEGKLVSIFRSKKEINHIKKLFFSHSCIINLGDKNYNSIDIPKELEEWACIKEKVAIITKPDRIEIWAKENKAL
jgi:DNA-binding transcriptional regulator/RsmH inhibitor MraZ